MKARHLVIGTAIVMIVAGCAVIQLTVEPDIELPVVPIPDNPYLQMLRALDTMQLDAHIVLEEGRFTVPKLPVAGDVHLQVPGDLDLHVILNIKFKKKYKEEAETTSENLVSIQPEITSASIRADKPIPVQAGGVKIELQNVDYEGGRLSTELALRLDLIGFFVSPASGVLIDEVNENVIRDMVQQVEIHSLVGRFAEGQRMALENVAFVIGEDSRVELADVLFVDEEQVQGSTSLFLNLQRYQWSRKNTSLLGRSRSRLEINDLRFAYQEGDFSLRGGSDDPGTPKPFRLTFAGEFASEKGTLVVGAGSELVLHTIEALFPKKKEPDVRVSAGMTWNVPEGTMELPGVVLAMKDSVLELPVVDITRNPSGDILQVEGMKVDANLVFSPANSDDLRKAINESVNERLVAPVKSFKVTKLSFPGQRYLVSNFRLEMRNWNEIVEVGGDFLLMMNPGHLVTFKAGLDVADGIELVSRLHVDALNIPLHFEYDGQIAGLTQPEPFIAGATLELIEPMTVYRSTIGEHSKKIPKEMKSLVKVPFKVSVLPSQLSVMISAQLEEWEGRDWLAIRTADFSGRLVTELKASDIARIEVRVPFGTAGNYSLNLKEKLPLGQSVTFKDDLNIKARVLVAPFTPLSKIAIPLGRIIEE